ncbi:S-adenosyl-L-methionine-dependent methyltransferase [Plectosphaerella cucumerina]|uniref:S-adenosyl-L-methionine-dependent methyltransferase n=1 Tax=Plectosphaerella cucumerina TaxID=40658 RepID=A0A8K0X6Z4_9PEZI|nr:S-adenosyl-L-methionine-dependent methyltransferase [Plectosphaerella cucumerina]
MTTTAQTTIPDLTAKITELSAAFTKALAENNIPSPTFAADSPTNYEGLTGELFLQRQQLLDHLNDLTYLVQGPSESIFNYAHNCMPDVAALNLLNHFDFWSAVPLDGSSTYDAIAEHTALPREVVQRILEHGFTLRIFEKTVFDGTVRVRHSSRSAALAQSTGLKALVSTVLDDAGPPMLVMQEALDKYSRGKKELAQDMTQTSFALYHSGKLAGNYANSWEFIENDGKDARKGWRQRNFVEFMNYIKQIFRLEDVVEKAFDWASLGKGTIVDLGGSGGHDSMVLAKKFPNLAITVQDLPQARTVFDKNITDDLKPRVTFDAHDFFKPQTIQADIFLIKLILHDWPDNESVQILRNLVPAMRPGSRVLFIDYVGKQDTLTAEGSDSLPRSIQQFGTSTDLRMMALFSAKERPVDAWKDIFRKADERFDLVRVEANPLTFMVIMEAVWKP